MLDDEGLSPLHVASKEGHTAIIVALVEEGGADVNILDGESKATPLMLSVRKFMQDSFLHVDLYLSRLLPPPPFPGSRGSQ